MKRAFTLVEIIITIVILSILAIGTLVSVKHLYIRTAKSKMISDLSSDSQVISDQILSLLYDRVPSSVIGYRSNGAFSSIYDLGSTYSIIEWIGIAQECLKIGYYSGFVDLNSSDKNSITIISPDINKTGLDSVMNTKFNSNSLDLALIFAGSFDSGSIALSNDFNDSFGWHGNGHNLIYDITINDNNLTLSTTPDTIYEKYYLVDSAYAVTRGENIDINATCIKDLNQSIGKNTLFLFYNYRPWKNQTFCADPNGSNQDGNVTILSKNVSGFEVGLVNNNIQFNLSLKKHLRGIDGNITISKQKVIF